MQFKDYYSVLGVEKTSSNEEIKRAYRKLARKYHPDLNPGDKAAEARFKELNEAHEVLGDPDKRRKYDELGANWRMYEQGPPPGGRTTEPSGAAWTFDSGGPGGSRTMTHQEMRDLFGREDPFSDFFHAFFGGRAEAARRPGRSRAQRGRDVEQTLELSLEDAFHGARRRLAIKHDGHARTVEGRIPAGGRDGGGG